MIQCVTFLPSNSWLLSVFLYQSCDSTKTCIDSNFSLKLLWKSHFLMHVWFSHQIFIYRIISYTRDSLLWSSYKVSLPVFSPLIWVDFLLSKEAHIQKNSVLHTHFHIGKTYWKNCFSGIWRIPTISIFWWKWLDCHCKWFVHF